MKLVMLKTRKSDFSTDNGNGIVIFRALCVTGTFKPSVNFVVEKRMRWHWSVRLGQNVTTRVCEMSHCLCKLNVLVDGQEDRQVSTVVLALSRLHFWRVLLVVVGIIDRADDVDERLLLLRSPPPTCYIAQLFATIQRVKNCLSNAMRGQNINLPACVCVCVSVTLSVNSPTGQTPQRIFTVDSLKDVDLRK